MRDADEAHAALLCSEGTALSFRTFLVNISVYDLVAHIAAGREIASRPSQSMYTLPRLEQENGIY
jgi:hypothetical protein